MTVEQTTARPEPSPEDLAVRSLIVALKVAVKQDAVSIREEKAIVKALQTAAAEQSRLCAHRVDARSRLLIYGSLRGRAWERMENRHGAATMQLGWAIQRVWKIAQAANAEQTGTVVPFPEACNQFLTPGMRAIVR